MLINFNLTYSFSILSSIKIEGSKHCISFFIFGNNSGAYSLFKLMTDSLIYKLYSFSKMIKTLWIISPFGNLFKLIINNLCTILIILFLLQTKSHLILDLCLVTITIYHRLLFSFLFSPRLYFKTSVNHQDVLLVLCSGLELGGL